MNQIEDEYPYQLELKPNKFETKWEQNKAISYLETKYNQCSTTSAIHNFFSSSFETDKPFTVLDYKGSRWLYFKNLEDAIICRLLS